MVLDMGWTGHLRPPSDMEVSEVDRAACLRELRRGAGGAWYDTRNEVFRPE